MGIPISTRVIRRAQPDRLSRKIVASGLFLASQSILAQELPQQMMPPVRDPAFGHSAEYYGISHPAQQEASIRSVLSSVQLDRAYLPSSLAAEAAYLAVRLFVGGQGAPTDIADPRSGAVLSERE